MRVVLCQVFAQVGQRAGPKASFAKEAGNMGGTFQSEGRDSITAKVLATRVRWCLPLCLRENIGEAPLLLPPRGFPMPRAMNAEDAARRLGSKKSSKKRLLRTPLRLRCWRVTPPPHLFPIHDPNFPVEVFWPASLLR